MEILEQIFIFIIGYAILGLLVGDFQLKKYLLFRLDNKTGEELGDDANKLRKEKRFLVLVITIFLVLEAIKIIKRLFF